ncbi:hypothetical protein NDU88_003715 [Pleurodeles waltl]|uniref:Uncharacterized protein n=1 Tax=Pleurodeles waltl TaxID=8319 RepID=A0AAV7RJ05_PLEWA|nr:hypothetical protein NDU88_003715 [Pleurodeles waltl]
MGGKLSSASGVHGVLALRAKNSTGTPRKCVATQLDVNFSIYSASFCAAGPEFPGQHMFFQCSYMGDFLEDLEVARLAQKTHSCVPTRCLGISLHWALHSYRRRVRYTWLGLEPGGSQSPAHKPHSAGNKLLDWTCRRRSWPQDNPYAQPLHFAAKGCAQLLLGIRNGFETLEMQQKQLQKPNASKKGYRGRDRATKQDGRLERVLRAATILEGRREREDSRTTHRVRSPSTSITAATQNHVWGPRNSGA